jgi:hypothetical protein
MKLDPLPKMYQPVYRDFAIGRAQQEIRISTRHYTAASSENSTLPLTDRE